MSDNDKPAPDAPRTRVIPLRYGVEADGARIEQLAMRPPLARDSRDAQRGAGSAADMEIRLLANLCSVSPDAIEQLHMADYRRVQTAYEDFLEG